MGSEWAHNQFWTAVDGYIGHLLVEPMNYAQRASVEA